MTKSGPRWLGSSCMGAKGSLIYADLGLVLRRLFSGLETDPRVCPGHSRRHREVFEWSIYTSEEAVEGRPCAKQPNLNHPETKAGA
jgi:hypothetical protein